MLTHTWKFTGWSNSCSGDC